MRIIKKCFRRPFGLARKAANRAGYDILRVPRSTASHGAQVITVDGDDRDYMLEPKALSFFQGASEQESQAAYAPIRNRIEALDPVLEFPILGHGDASAGGNENVLAYLGPSRVHRFLTVIRWCEACGIDLEGKQAIDVGTGLGALPFLLKDRWKSADITASDANAGYVAIASALFPEIETKQTLLEAQQGQFDAVFFTEILEHMADPKGALGRLSELVRPGGHLVVTVPDGRYDQMEPYALVRETGSYGGHVNFWSIESWFYFLRSAIPGRTVSIGCRDGHVLFACVNF